MRLILSAVLDAQARALLPAIACGAVVRPADPDGAAESILPRPADGRDRELLRDVGDLVARYELVPFAGEGEPGRAADTLDPFVLVPLYLLATPERRGRGVYHTPPGAAAFVCREVLKALLSETALPRGAASRLVDRGRADGLGPNAARAALERLAGLRVADPACGCGAFLLELARQADRLGRLLRTSYGEEPAGGASGVGLYGRDIDPLAVGVCRLRLLVAERWERGADAEALRRVAGRVVVQDGLHLAAEPPEAIAPPRRSGGHVDPAGTARPREESFDAVLINPPYLNMVAMKARHPEQRRRIRRQFATARGGFDLFVPFVERGLQMLRPGGILAALTPDKILGAGYAQALRAHYWKRADLLGIADLRDAVVFDAHVYPVVTFGRLRPQADIALRSAPGSRADAVKRSAPGPRADAVKRLPAGPRTGGEPRPVQARTGRVRIWHASTAPDGSLRVRAGHGAPLRVVPSVGHQWDALLDPACARMARLIAGMPRLCDLADVIGAATVAEAYALRAALIDNGHDLARSEPDRYATFLVSGSLRPHGHTWEEKPVRYLGRLYRCPVIDVRHPALSPRRRQQVREAKLIVSGLARRPICVWDLGGIAAGKSTVLIRPRDAELGGYLAGVLNAAIYGRIYRWLFGSLRLAGGYLRFGPPQLRALPVPDAPTTERRAIARLVKRLTQATGPAAEALTARIDARVGALLGVTSH